MDKVINEIFLDSAELKAQVNAVFSKISDKVSDLLEKNPGVITLQELGETVDTVIDHLLDTSKQANATFPGFMAVDDKQVAAVILKTSDNIDKVFEAAVATGVVSVHGAHTPQVKQQVFDMVKATFRD